MLDLKSIADIYALIEEKLPEGLSLEYKSSPALRKTNEARSELVKDVTAFANSAGGQIVYGIIESGGLPNALDAGVDTRETSADWISQVLETSVSPRIQGLKIDTIPLTDDAPDLALLVITIPVATTFAPHQNSLDKRYYKRSEGRAVPMHDYEIRDVLRRGQLPEIRAAFVFGDGSERQPISGDQPFLDFLLRIENVSAEPALYSLVDFMFDKRLVLVNDAGLKRAGEYVIDDYSLHKLQKTMMVPNDFPLLRGSNISFGPPYVRFAIPPRYQQSTNFLLGYSALTSGFSQTRLAILSVESGFASIGPFIATYGSSILLKD